MCCSLKSFFSDPLYRVFSPYNCSTFCLSIFTTHFDPTSNVNSLCTRMMEATFQILLGFIFECQTKQALRGLIKDWVISICRPCIHLHTYSKNTNSQFPNTQLIWRLFKRLPTGNTLCHSSIFSKIPRFYRIYCMLPKIPLGFLFLISKQTAMLITSTQPLPVLRIQKSLIRCETGKTSLRF